jgi:hypothetical protein
MSGNVPNDLATAFIRALIANWNPDSGVARTNGPQGEVTLATFATSVPTRLFGPGERIGRGRLHIG